MPGRSPSLLHPLCVPLTAWQFYPGQATCNDKDAAPPDDPVTNAECEAGSAGFFATVSATGACAGAPCDMAVADDLVACCTACDPVANAATVTCTDATNSVAATCAANYAVASGACVAADGYYTVAAVAADPAAATCTGMDTAVEDVTRTTDADGACSTQTYGCTGTNANAAQCDDGTSTDEATCVAAGTCDDSAAATGLVQATCVALFSDAVESATRTTDADGACSTQTYSCTGTNTNAAQCDDGTSTDQTTCEAGDGVSDAGSDGDTTLDGDGVWTAAAACATGACDATCTEACAPVVTAIWTPKVWTAALCAAGTCDATCTEACDPGAGTDCAVNTVFTSGDQSAGTCATTTGCTYAAIGSTTPAEAASVAACTAVANAATVTCTDATNSVAATCAANSAVDNGACVADAGFYISAASVAACTAVANAATVTCTDATNSVAATCAANSAVVSGACVADAGYYTVAAVAAVPAVATCDGTATDTGTTSDCAAAYATAGADASTDCEVGCTYTDVGDTTSASVASVGTCAADVANAATVTCTSATDSVAASCAMDYDFTTGACVLSQAACSTLACADGWVADSTAAAALCASNPCVNSGDDNALCCDACTSQDGCATDGATCSVVTGLEDKLICASNANNYLVDAAGTVTACAANSIIGAGQGSPGATCLEVSAEECVANQESDGTTCSPCAAGTTSAAPATGVTAADGATTCTATLCAENEFVLANACVACAPGSESAANADASTSIKGCTLIPTTGMCTGNTGGTGDVTCGTDKMAKPDPETIEGTDEAACCDVVPTAPPTVEYTWEATPWTTCAFGCGTRAASARTVTCTSLTIYSTGAVVRADEDLEVDATTECTGDEPAATQACATLAAGTPCDDSNPETTADQCTTAEAAGVCEGKQVLVSALTFDMDIATIDVSDIPVGATTEQITESAAGQALSTSIKASLTGSFGSDIVVTILSITAGSLVVDYKVDVPATAVVDQAHKDAAASAISAAADIALPAATGGGTVAASAPIVEPFKLYAYVRTAGSCPAATCSAACGYEGLTAADVYACQEDGVSVAAASCVGAGIGAALTTATECCPAADADTCEQSAAEVTAPPPSIADVCGGLTGQEALDCVVEESGFPVGAIIVIILAVPVIGLVLVYCFCKSVCSCIFGGDDEKPAAGRDVEAGGNADEKREVLEKRLAHVRNQLPEEGA